MEPWVDFSVGFIFEVGCEFFRTSLFLNNYRLLRSCSMTWREPTCSPPSSRHGTSHRLVQASKPGSWQLTGLRTLLSSLLTYGNGGRRDEGTLGWGNSIWVRISHERFWIIQEICWDWQLSEGKGIGGRGQNGWRGPAIQWWMIIVFWWWALCSVYRCQMTMLCILRKVIYQFYLNRNILKTEGKEICWKGLEQIGQASTL